MPRLFCSVLLCSFVLALSGCGRSPEKRAEQYIKSADRYMERRDYPRAVLQYSNAVRILKTNAEAYYKLGLAHLAAGNLKAAATSLYRAAELNPGDARIQVKLAQLMTVGGNEEVVRQAEKRITDFLRGAPDNRDALDTLALAELRLGKLDDAEEHLRDSLSRFPGNVQSSAMLAGVRIARRDYAGAEQALRDAVAQSPKSVEPLLALGQYYLLTGNLAQAGQQFKAAAALDPNNGRVLMGIGAVQYRMGDASAAEQTFKKLASSPDEAYKPVYGTYLLQAGNYPAATGEFERLLKLAPKDRTARTRLVTAYLAANRTGDAERVLTSALDENPKDVDARLQRAELLIRRGRVEDAQKDLTLVLRYKPESAEAHYLLAAFHRGRRAPLQERAELTEALRLRSGFLQARIELARNLLTAGDAKSASAVLDEAPPEQKRTRSFIVQRNWVLLRAGDTGEYRKGVAQALALGRTPDILVQETISRLQERNYASARASALEVLEKKPDSVEALSLLARAFVEDQKESAAIVAVRGYAEKHPDSARIQHFAGAFLISRNAEPAEARQFLEKARSLDPEFLPPAIALANLDLQEDKLEHGRTLLEAIAPRDPSNLTVQLLSAAIEDRAGNYNKAAEHYRKALLMDPRNVFALNNLAYLVGERWNQFDQALTYAQQAAELAPDNPAVADTIGWMLYRKGLYTNARTYLEQAASKSASALPKYHLAMLYFKLGDSQRGKSMMQSALKINPDLAKTENIGAVR